MNNDELLKTNPSMVTLDMDMNQPYVTETEHKVNSDGSQSTIQRTYTKEAFLMKMINDNENVATQLQSDNQRIETLGNIIEQDNAAQIQLEQIKLAQEQQAAATAIMQQQAMAQQAVFAMMMQQQMMLGFQQMQQQMMIPQMNQQDPQQPLLIGGNVEPQIQQNEHPRFVHGVSEDVEYVVVDDNGQTQYTPPVQTQQPMNPQNDSYNGINFSDIESGL